MGSVNSWGDLKKRRRESINCIKFIIDRNQGVANNLLNGPPHKNRSFYFRDGVSIREYFLKRLPSRTIQNQAHRSFEWIVISNENDRPRKHRVVFYFQKGCCDQTTSWRDTISHLYKHFIQPTSMETSPCSFSFPHEYRSH